MQSVYGMCQRLKTFNRTIVELKLANPLPIMPFRFAFNRTIVELKLNIIENHLRQEALLIEPLWN